MKSFHPTWRLLRRLVVIVSTAWLTISGLVMHAGLDIKPLQQQLTEGHADEVREVLDRALENSPENPRLLYNRAIASYATGRFEEALVDLELVENSSSKWLVNKARFQKGNAEFHLGKSSLTNDLDAAISHWKQSLGSYDALLKEQPDNVSARQNRDHVHKLLLDLLMKAAAENLEKAQKNNLPPEPRITALRSAMEQFHDANQMDQHNDAARQGEQTARDMLAQLLAQEGARKTLANTLILPKANEPPVMRPDIGQIQEGVNMLEDANALKPDDKSIASELEKGRERLAMALTRQAIIYQSLEPRLPRTDDKLGLLRMALEQVEKALEQKPDLQIAQQVQEQIKQRLAELHEQEGDKQAAEAQNSALEEQARQLSQALDHFQQASGLQPRQARLPQKAKQTQDRLEQALAQLGDKLMKEPGEGESSEQQVMRLEGAEQAFKELQSLNPSEQTAEKALQAGEQLAKARQQLASRKPQPGEQPGMPNPAMAQMPAPPQPNTDGMPMDSPPKLDTPGVRGPYQSPAMNRSLRDY